MFNPQALQQATLQKLEEAAKSQALQSNKTDYSDSLFKIGWLPEGNHQVRIIPDINSNLSHLQYLHNISKRNKCRRATFQDPVSDCPICSAIFEAEDNGIEISYKMKRSAMSKALIYLINTDKPTEYWKPGNFYIAIQSNKRLNDAIVGVLTMISNAAEKNPNAWNIFNPEAADQPSFELQVTMGQSGKVTLQSNMYSPAPALNLTALLGENKLPDLSEAYISDKQVNEQIEEESLKQINAFIMQSMNGAVTQQSTTPPTTNVASATPPAESTQQPSTTAVANTAPVQSEVQQPTTTVDTATVKTDEPTAGVKKCFGQFNVMNAECNSCEIKQQCVTFIMTRNNGGN